MVKLITCSAYKQSNQSIHIFVHQKAYGIKCSYTVHCKELTCSDHIQDLIGSIIFIRIALYVHYCYHQKMLLLRYYVVLWSSLSNKYMSCVRGHIGKSALGTSNANAAAGAIIKKQLISSLSDSLKTIADKIHTETRLKTYWPAVGSSRNWLCVILKFQHPCGHTHIQLELQWSSNCDVDHYQTQNAFVQDSAPMNIVSLCDRWGRL